MAPSRRTWLRRVAAAAAMTPSLSGWLERFAAAAATDPARRRSCILLWMNGGPSQLDTFDPKPDHANGGQFKPIQTAVAGVRLSEHLPKLAARMKDLAVVRSMSTREADHGRASYLMRTGRPPGGPIRYPTFGSVVAREFERTEAELPGFVSIAPFRFLSPEAYGPGFLGTRYAPLVVGEQTNFGQRVGPGDLASSLRVEDLDRPAGVTEDRFETRRRLLDAAEDEFLTDRPGAAAEGHRTAYRRAITMMRSAAAAAFDLSGEPPALRDAYGRTVFGQGCLLARRLVERGVPFVEVTLSEAPGVAGIGWDSHQDNFRVVRSLSQVLDAGWAALIDDLSSRGLLESTLVVWMGEFGRTPVINRTAGRDHWATSWSTVLAGGGIHGGQVVGATSPDGTEVKDRPVAVADLLATVGLALGLDVSKQNESNVGRPIRLVEPGAQPLREVLA